MWRDIVAQISLVAERFRLHQLVQLAHLCLQKIDLLLLAKDSAVELFQMIFSEAELDLEFGNSGLHADSFSFSQKGRLSGVLFAPRGVQHCLDQAKFFAAKSQLAKELRKVSTNFGRALR